MIEKIYKRSFLIYKLKKNRIFFPKFYEEIIKNYKHK